MHLFLIGAVTAAVIWPVGAFAYIVWLTRRAGKEQEFDSERASNRRALRDPDGRVRVCTGCDGRGVGVPPIRVPLVGAFYIGAAPSRRRPQGWRVCPDCEGFGVITEAV
jgi:hypothetical protein